MSSRVRAMVVVGMPWWLVGPGHRGNEGGAGGPRGRPGAAAPPHRPRSRAANLATATSRGVLLLRSMPSLRPHTPRTLPLDAWPRTGATRKECRRGRVQSPPPAWTPSGRRQLHAPSAPGSANDGSGLAAVVAAGPADGAEGLLGSRFIEGAPSVAAPPP